jgi:hypothetical protein
MKGLETLGRSMLELDVDIQRFNFASGAASFDCLFSMRGKYQLSLTSRGLKPKFFLFEVKSNFHMLAYFTDGKKDILDVLRTHGISKSGFKAAEFFAALDKSVPSQASSKWVPTGQEIIQLRHDLEERDKPYFDTWIPWGEGRSPSDDNKNKTSLLLGVEAAQYSKDMNASSKWSATDLKRKWR